jgi:DNA-binding NarL/FixJ family response regulator
LDGYEHLVVVGEAANGKEAISQTNALSPDVVLMDIEMPKLDGLAATQVLAREEPKSKVLILSVHKDAQYLVQIMQAGALGFISKEATPTELVRAIETVAAGNKFFGSNTAATLKESTARKRLSPREQKVLAGIAEGLSNKEIASRLGLGVRTVETHRERLMRKLNIHSTAGLTRFAISQGLTFFP